MKTLADLKRTLTVGTRLTLIDTNMVGHKYLNITRAIEKVQTNSIKFEGGSWLEFGKAADYTINDREFTQTFPEFKGQREYLTYRIEA